LRPLAASLFPDARIVVVPDYRVLPDFAQVDAAVWSLEQAAALARSTPGITAVVPRDLGNLSADPGGSLALVPAVGLSQVEPVVHEVHHLVGSRWHEVGEEKRGAERDTAASLERRARRAALGEVTGRLTRIGGRRARSAPQAPRGRASRNA